MNTFWKRFINYFVVGILVLILNTAISEWFKSNETVQHIDIVKARVTKFDFFRHRQVILTVQTVEPFELIDSIGRYSVGDTLVLSITHK